MNVEPIANEILKRAAGAARFVVAIAGPPCAGKSTLAEALAETLVAGGVRASRATSSADWTCRRCVTTRRSIWRT